MAGILNVEVYKNPVSQYTFYSFSPFLRIISAVVIQYVKEALKALELSPADVALQP